MTLSADEKAKLHLELKNMLIEVLDLEEVEASDIKDQEPLFVEGLGLDSIDALEIGLALQQRYGITLNGDSEDTKKHFASIESLAELVTERRAK